MPTTPSQTVGPFFAIELPYGDGRYAVPEGTPGGAIPGRGTKNAGIFPYKKSPAGRQLTIVFTGGNDTTLETLPHGVP